MNLLGSALHDHAVSKARKWTLTVITGGEGRSARIEASNG